VAELEEERQKYISAVYISIFGCLAGWAGLESMTVGLRISKSGLASYAEQCGIIVPFAFDILIFNRQFLATDGIGVALILVTQGYSAYSSTLNVPKVAKQAKERKQRREKESLLNED